MTLGTWWGRSPGTSTVYGATESFFDHLIFELFMGNLNLAPMSRCDLPVVPTPRLLWGFSRLLRLSRRPSRNSVPLWHRHLLARRGFELAGPISANKNQKIPSEPHRRSFISFIWTGVWCKMDSTCMEDEKCRKRTHSKVYSFTFINLFTWWPIIIIQLNKIKIEIQKHPWQELSAYLDHTSKVPSGVFWNIFSPV